MAAKKETLANLILSAVLRNIAYVSDAVVYVALYTTAPTATTQGTEVIGSDTYVRLPVTFAAPSAGSTMNHAAAVTFAAAGASWGNVKAAAICSSAVIGTDDQLYFGLLGTAKDVGIGDVLNFAIDALVVSES